VFRPVNGVAQVTEEASQEGNKARPVNCSEGTSYHSEGKKKIGKWRNGTKKRDERRKDNKKETELLNFWETKAPPL